VKLLLRFIKPGLPDVTPPPESDTEDRPLAFAY
jgi:hypothetical protein